MLPPKTNPTLPGREPATNTRRFILFIWANLAYNFLVILWGAFVRATGSGAGCGAHWPLCDGQVIPRAPDLEQMIEYSHRLTSGIALIGTVILAIWAFRIYPKGHIVRMGAGFTLAFMIIEALIGAGLVLLGWVAHNVSLERSVSLALHLFNTFLLIGAMMLTGWWASGGPPIQLRGQGRLLWLIAIGLLLTGIVGSSGAITAMGDTLIHLGAIEGDISQGITPESHPLVQIRILHPILGLLVGVYVVILAWHIAKNPPTPDARKFAYSLIALFILQGLIGGLNVTLKAPVWMQLIHLLVADILWLNLVLLSAMALIQPKSYGRAVSPVEASPSLPRNTA